MKPEVALDLIERGVKKPPKARHLTPASVTMAAMENPNVGLILDRGQEEGEEREREEEGDVIEVSSSSSSF